jgi:hypothetical protein
MKRILFLIFAASLILASCNRDRYKEKLEVDLNNSTQQLTVPLDFNWKTTTDYHLTFTASKNGIVEIQSEEGLVFHRANLTLGNKYKTKLAVPSYVKNLVIFHRGQKTLVELNNELIDLTI